MFTNKRQRAFLLLGLVALAISLPLTALAAPVGQRGGGDAPHRGGGDMIMRFLENPEVREAADITDEQVDALQEIHREAEATAIALRAEAEIVQLELEGLWDVDDPDADAIHDKIDEGAEIHANLRHAQADARLAAKDVLSPEQIEALREIGRERMQERREQRGERREGARQELRDRFGNRGQGGHGGPGGQGGPAPDAN